MSTSCVFPLPIDDAFRFARLSGFDGVEVMVTAERATRDARLLRDAVARWGLPVLSVHSPVLPVAHFAFGRDQREKLLRSAELAAELGAGTVVVHPPFRWQRRFAPDFTTTVRDVEAATGVVLAVENMFPVRVGPVRADVYAPSHDPVLVDCRAATLDFSHAAVAGRDALDLALALGSRLRHVHLCDGTLSTRPGGLHDEHLVPGHGSQPVAEVLGHLAGSGWTGSVVAEVHGARGRHDRLATIDRLRETVAFARTHLAAGRTTAAPDAAANAGAAATTGASAEAVAGAPVAMRRGSSPARRRAR